MLFSLALVLTPAFQEPAVPPRPALQEQTAAHLGQARALRRERLIREIARLEQELARKRALLARVDQWVPEPAGVHDHTAGRIHDRVSDGLHDRVASRRAHRAEQAEEHHARVKARAEAHHEQVQDRREARRERVRTQTERRRLQAEEKRPQAAKRGDPQR